MKGSRVLLVAVLAFGSLAACNKPSEEACEQAIENMRRLLGTEGLTTDIDAQVRRCRGGSSKEAVACAIKAKTREELVACKFAKFDEQKPAPGSGSGSGSGSGAGSGSAP